MREFLAFVAGKLVDRPEEVEVREEQRDGERKFLLLLPADEVGKIIGKQGHTIRAVRNLLQAAASRQDLRTLLEIVER